MSHSLHLHLAKAYVGEVIYSATEAKFSFKYHPSWVQNGFEISPHIPLHGRSKSESIRRFLENLLPEGEGLESLCRHFHISKSNTMSLARAIGTETTGALTFCDVTEPAVNTEFRKVSVAELTERIRNLEFEDLIVWDGKLRLSVAGVQHKLPILVINDEYGFGEGNLASSHILKFENKKQHHIVLNEYVCMTLAAKIGLPVAPVKLKRFDEISALLVERFDRRRIDSKRVERLHIIDGCQALDLSPSYKYERNFGSSKDVAHIRDGASLEKLFSFCNQCEIPIKATLTVLQWTLFNLLISNVDSHGKNISFFVGRTGYMPAPFYDLVNVAMYPKFDQEMAMGIGDEFLIGGIRAYQFAQQCRDCNINPNLLYKQLIKMISKLAHEIEILDLEGMLINREESAFVNKLLSNILNNTSHFLNVAEDISKAFDI